MSPYADIEYYIVYPLSYFILYNIKLQSSTFELIIELVLLNQDRHQGKNVRQYLPLKYSDEISDESFRLY